MLSFDQAQSRFAESVAPVREAETVWLELAAGRVLARQLAARGDEALPAAGTLLQPGHIAALAAQGHTEVPVFRLVEVALLIADDRTANDLPATDRPDANGPMLEALVQSLGALVRRRKHVADDERRLHDALVDLADPGGGGAGRAAVGGAWGEWECDVVFVSGASHRLGAALVSAGGELICRQVDMQPGRTVLLGRLRDCPVVCLPADPVAAYITFVLLATPMIRRLQGRASIFPPVDRLAPTFAVPRQWAGDGAADAFWGVARAPGGDGTGRVHAAAQPWGSVATLGDAAGLVRLAPPMSGRTQPHVPYYDLSRWLC
ncbi:MULTISPECIES: molybdopterin-binding domain-containing protein [unclassified Cupriavidus]|uniref:hypothetical protein n=1 Tax=Cupriavidus sp. H19C3 TaxID=3241603 RepID=UPI003BF8E30C